MASIISAGTTSGTSLNLSGDTSGVLQLASNGSTTAVTIDTNQRAAFVAGTAALPAITTTGDTNTGMWFPAADTIAFTEGGAESMRIDSSGNVGIGRTPDQRLQIAAPTAVEYDMFVDSTRTLTLYADATQTIIANPTAVPMIFRTSDTERMRIDSAGAMLVGTTTVYNTATTNVGFVGNVGSGISVNTTTATNGATFQVFLSTGTLIGSISNNNNTGVLYNVTSDYRLKNNAVALTGAKEFVMALKPKTWDWYNDLGKGVGFLAHEFMEVAKYSGFGEKDAVDSDGKPIYQTIQASSTEVMANIVALIQEQQTMIQELKAELDATKAEVQALKGTL